MLSLPRHPLSFSESTLEQSTFFRRNEKENGGDLEMPVKSLCNIFANNSSGKELEAQKQVFVLQH